MAHTAVEYHPENGTACWVAVMTKDNGDRLWFACQTKEKAEEVAARRNADT